VSNMLLLSYASSGSWTVAGCLIDVGMCALVGAHVHVCSTAVLYCNAAFPDCFVLSLWRQNAVL
jgi:hypothetical protein